MAYSKAVGSRAEVMHGTARHTSGDLTKKDLKYNKQGRIVSKRASEAGKRAYRRNKDSMAPPYVAGQRTRRTRRKRRTRSVRR